MLINRVIFCSSMISDLKTREFNRDDLFLIGRPDDADVVAFEQAIVDTVPCLPVYRMQCQERTAPRKQFLIPI